MIDTYFKKYFWTFHLGVLFVAGLLVAKTVNAFVAGALRPPASTLAKISGRAGTPRKAGKNKSGAPLTAFLERNLFKAAREDLVPEPDAADAQADDGEYVEDNCEASTLSAKLVATIVSSNQESSMAVFAGTGKDGKAEAYRVGDKVMDQAEVMSIEWRAVRVKRNGRCEMFSLEEQKQKTVASRGAPPPPAGKGKKKVEFGKDIKKLGANEFEIPRGEIDNVLSNLNQIATQARIVPSFHNGKANGFKLFSIRPGSLYSKIGIQNGDVIQKINGFEINSPDKALEIYSKLKDANSISVDLVRRGKSKSLAYTIR